MGLVLGLRGRAGDPRGWLVGLSAAEQTGAEDAGFHWVTLPDGVELRGDELFDPLRMRELFALGYEMARQGPRWQTRPPGYARVLGGNR